MIGSGKRQALWAMAAVTLLISLCICGLWFYVQQADAETDVQETSLAELPQEDEITITWEKYDSFPLLEETKENNYWREGYGLMRDEKARLESLRTEYANGKRPQNAAPTLPTQTGFAILPLDLASFGGMTEYYFLPDTLLTDEQLLQLIAYGEGRGVPFTADTLTAGNSMRGGDTQVNRLFSAGESERGKNLVQRFYQEGLSVPKQTTSDIALPVSGIAYIPMSPDLSGGIDKFALYPFRELTDEELLRATLSSGKQRFSILNPAEEADLNPAADNAWMRSLLEDVSNMPMSAEHIRSYYKRNDITGDIRLHGEYETARINGKKSLYSLEIDYQTKRPIYIRIIDDDQNYPEPVNPFVTPVPTQDMNDPKWADVVEAAIEKLDATGIDTVEATNFATFGNGQLPGVRFIVTMADGDCYSVSLSYSDGLIKQIMYGADGQDPLMWYMDHQW